MEEQFRAFLLLLRVAVLALAGVQPAQAQPASPPVRAEVPIREVILSDGTRRYGVPVRVGGKAIEAGLDTGSSGLRILPGALNEADVQATSRRDSYSYAAGAKLDGEIGHAIVSVGQLSGSTTVQLVHRVGCSTDQPGCAAGSIPLSKYGIQGNGLPGEGFKAILGINMGDAPAASLFKGIGARRWIIELPRPGESTLGRIVLNPTDKEVANFTIVPVLDAFASEEGGLHDSVRGCLMRVSDHQKFCGAALLDTGAPGIEVVNSSVSSPPWANETPVVLFFADAGDRIRVAESAIVGRRTHASRLTFTNKRGAAVTRLYLGLTPYFAFSVLYDPEHGTIGFKPRPPMTDGPQVAQVR